MEKTFIVLRTSTHRIGRNEFVRVSILTDDVETFLIPLDWYNGRFARVGIFPTDLDVLRKMFSVSIGLLADILDSCN